MGKKRLTFGDSFIFFILLFMLKKSSVFLILCSCIVLLIAGISSCKDDSITSLDQPIPLQLQRMVGGQDLIFANEMLCFRDSAHFELVHDSLTVAWGSSEEEPYYPDTNEYVMVHPVLVHFDGLFEGFVSLRKETEGKVATAMANGSFFEHNPEQDVVSGTVYRTLLNRYSEVKIGTTIYKYLDRNTLVLITNNDLEALYALRAGSNPGNLGPNISVIILSTGETGALDCSTAYYVRTQATVGTLGARQVRIDFNAGSFDRTYSIDWGDGTTVTSFTYLASTTNPTFPTHTYVNSGTYIATVKQTSPSCRGSVSKVRVGDMNANCAANLVANFTAQITGNGNDLSLTSNVTGNPTRYFWRVVETGSSSITYPVEEKNGNLVPWLGAFSPSTGMTQALPNGTYSICLAICDVNGCYAEACTTLTINACCRDFDETLNGNYLYYGGNSQGGRIMRFDLTKNAGPVNHRIITESKHYVKRKKNNGKGNVEWRETNADKLAISRDGNVYRESKDPVSKQTSYCEQAVSVVASKSKSNVQSLSENQSIGKKFGTTNNNRPEATFTVRYNSIDYTHKVQFVSCN